MLREIGEELGVDFCSPTSYAYMFMHGESGKGGIWKARNVPEKYEDCRIANLPTMSPSSSDGLIRRYSGTLSEKVKDGVGLYLFSVPTTDNKLGTGNGKTTTAISLLNDYTILRVIEHLKGDKLKHNPSLFMRISDFQNIYNSQFRGSIEMQKEASRRYYKAKESMKQVYLLVADDIAIRSATEAFVNELYEIIEHRATEELCTIFTSNVPLNNLEPVYGDRIVSRIEGMAIPVGFNGIDRRRKI